MSARRSTRSQPNGSIPANRLGTPGNLPARAPPQFIQYALDDPPTVSVVAMVEMTPGPARKHQVLVPFETVWEVLWGSGVPSDVIINDPLLTAATKCASFKSLPDHQLHDMVRFARQMGPVLTSKSKSPIRIVAPPKSIVCGVIALQDLARILPRQIAHVSRPSSPQAGATNGIAHPRAPKPTHVPLPLRAFNPDFVLDERGAKWAATLPQPTPSSSLAIGVPLPQSPPRISTTISSRRSAPAKLVLATIDVSDSSNDADNESDSDVEFVGFKSRRPMSVEWVTSPPPRKRSRSMSFGPASGSRSSQHLRESVGQWPLDEWRRVSPDDREKLADAQKGSQNVGPAAAARSLDTPVRSPSTPTLHHALTSTPTSTASHATATPRISSSPIMSFSSPTSLFGSASTSAFSGQSGLETDDTDTMRERSYLRLTASMESMTSMNGDDQDDELDEIEPTPSPEPLSIPLGQLRLTASLHPLEETSAPGSGSGSSRSEAEEAVDAAAMEVLTQVKGRAKGSKPKEVAPMSRLGEDEEPHMQAMPEVESPTILSQQPAASFVGAMPRLHLDDATSGIGGVKQAFGFHLGNGESQSIMSQPRQPSRTLVQSTSTRRAVPAPLSPTVAQPAGAIAGSPSSTQHERLPAKRSPRASSTPPSRPSATQANSTPVFNSAKRTTSRSERTPTSRRDYPSPSAFRLTSSQRAIKKRMFQMIESTSASDASSGTETETDEEAPPSKRPRLEHDAAKQSGEAGRTLVPLGNERDLSSWPSSSSSSSSSSSREAEGSSGSSSQEGTDEEDAIGSALSRNAGAMVAQEIPVDLLRALMPLRYAMAAARVGTASWEFSDGNSHGSAPASEAETESGSGSDSGESESESESRLSESSESSGSSDSECEAGENSSASESSEEDHGSSDGESNSNSSCASSDPEDAMDVDSPNQPLSSPANLLRMLFPLSYRPSTSRALADEGAEDETSSGESDA